MFKILGRAKDLKSGANVVYCQTTPEKYLKIVGQGFKDFELQRKKESHKAYSRLKKDIIEGALLPSITLAVKHNLVKDILSNLDNENKLTEILSSEAGIVDILDGLQRTHILKEIEEQESTFKEGQTLLLEYWLEENLSNIVYRMIVLNSGQKAMSMRHQIDLLFSTTKETIEEKIPGIELYTERDEKRRTSYNKYPLNIIASSYFSFLKMTPEQDSENIVNDQLKNNEIFESTKERIDENFDNFIQILQKFTAIDSLAWNIYRDEPDVDDGSTWLGSSNVIVSFFAAAGLLCKNNLKGNVIMAMDHIIQELNELTEQGAPYDYFSIERYNNIIKHINVNKVNVGIARRKYIFLMFKEYLKSKGDLNFSACWDMAAI